MTGLFDKLNLSTQERRLVVAVSIFVFIVLNVWLVWPHFGDLARWQQRRKDAGITLARYKDEIAKQPKYNAERDALVQLAGPVAEEARGVGFQYEVEKLARNARIAINRLDASGRASTLRTNEFFDEQTIIITFEADEPELVDFLYSLCTSESLIRVRTMALQPNHGITALNANLTLVESFQRKPTRRPAATTPAAAGTNTPVAAAPNPTGAGSTATTPAAASAGAGTASPSTTAGPAGAGRTTGSTVTRPTRPSIASGVRPQSIPPPTGATPPKTQTQPGTRPPVRMNTIKSQSQMNNPPPAQPNGAKTQSIPTPDPNSATNQGRGAVTVPKRRVNTPPPK